MTKSVPASRFAVLPQKLARWCSGDRGSDASFEFDPFHAAPIRRDRPVSITASSARCQWQKPEPSDRYLQQISAYVIANPLKRMQPVFHEEAT
ncbi:hypothetical protein D3OALGA1CA_670 [Olavius algarvensis associated proteobacterium Delta 3]|nr:hypothetical protein D3OALGA1CA_670 [Olavius algarvensis associated proteobacterium Delta 3]CAB5128585.1 hypothetical protein D3OALGB2SA_3455 [Olavius algarvensis associated proteobacterium Delta 3]